jgi:hypothetical protein
MHVDIIEHDDGWTVSTEARLPGVGHALTIADTWLRLLAKDADLRILYRDGRVESSSEEATDEFDERTDD